MSDWLHELPVPLIAVVVIAGIALLIAVIQLITQRLGAGRWGDAIRGVSPSLLPPLGIVFALIVGFLAVGVWGDVDKARDAVSSEASALRSVVLLSDEYPTATGSQLRGLVRQHIEHAVHVEWPQMRRRDASLAAISAPLREAQHTAFAFRPTDPGRVDAQRELVASLQQAFEARRQRIIVSDSHVNAVKWLGLIALAAVMLAAVACVHVANPRAALAAMSLFGAATAVVFTMLVAQDEPFTGHLGQKPDLLEQVLPHT
jgi:hypothetical protein